MSNSSYKIISKYIKQVDFEFKSFLIITPIFIISVFFGDLGIYSIFIKSGIILLLIFIAELFIIITANRSIRNLEYSKIYLKEDCLEKYYLKNRSLIHKENNEHITSISLSQLRKMIAKKDKSNNVVYIRLITTENKINIENFENMNEIFNNIKSNISDDLSIKTNTRIINYNNTFFRVFSILFSAIFSGFFYFRYGS